MYNRDNNGYLQAIIQITQAANSASPQNKALGSIARHTSKILKASGCSIMVLSPRKKHLAIIAAHGLSDQYLRKGALNVSKSLPEILEGKIVTVSDITGDDRTQYPEAAQLENISSITGAPIFNKGKINGEIRIYTSECRPFSAMEKDFLAAVANIISMVLEKFEFHKTLRKNLKDSTVIRKMLPETPALLFSSPSPSVFSHESEEEFAKLLDFYRIEWLYEPRSFPLAWRGKQITEMLTPDFFLPELDLYIELTTLKQSLITEKNRKLRRLRELYPEINIRLLNKNDYHRLLAKYGYGPLGVSRITGISRVLFSHTEIQRRTRALANLISNDYMDQNLVLIGVLKGVICFISDLMQQISLPLTVEFMGISYFESTSEKAVNITKDIDTNITGRNVLMIEDIVDTGMTLNYILNHLAEYKPASLRVCTLLDKRVRRLVNVPLEYVGFEVPDEFVVGYGLDYQGEYRNLPFIGVLHPETPAETSGKLGSPK
jgi:bifunctional protein TilS/HprT